MKRTLSTALLAATLALPLAAQEAPVSEPPMTLPRL